jgi:hypothetical protein
VIEALTFNVQLLCLPSRSEHIYVTEAIKKYFNNDLPKEITILNYEGFKYNLEEKNKLAIILMEKWHNR